MAAAAAKGWIVVAALSAAIAIAVGAFAAHGVDPSTEAGRKAREWLQDRQPYELIHALAILAVVVPVRGTMLKAARPSSRSACSSPAACSSRAPFMRSPSVAHDGSPCCPGAVRPSSWAG